MLYVILLIIIIIILFYYVNKINNNSTEFFENKGSAWTQSEKDKENAEKSFTSKQFEEIKNISTKISKDELTTLMSSQNSLLTGPPGPIGPSGPPGTTLIASGRLANKKNSFKKNNTNMFNPDFIVSRSEGTNPSSSVAFLEDVSPFVSYQNWQLDINNNIKNRYNGDCITMSGNNIYMDKCDPNNNNQKWLWDSRNRIISTNKKSENKLQCLSIVNKKNYSITSVPNCVGDKCLKKGPLNFLSVKDCDLNKVNDDEIWSFI